MSIVVVNIVVDGVKDEDLRRTLAHFGVRAEDFLGSGGEAYVFAWQDDWILRIAHAWVTEEYAQKRCRLLEELACSASSLSFGISRVHGLENPKGRVTTIEPRFRGTTLQKALDAPDADRAALVLACLNAAEELSSLSFEREQFGDIFWDPPTQSSRFSEYLRLRARRSLAMAGPEFSQVVVEPWTDAFEEPERPGFLHFDLSSHNILVDEGKVSALLDFSGMCMAGDPRWDPLACLIYLRVEGSASGAAETAGLAWLKERGLLHWLEPAEPVLAAIWSFAQDDSAVRRWTRQVLLEEVARAERSRPSNC